MKTAFWLAPIVFAPALALAAAKTKSPSLNILSTELVPEITTVTGSEYKLIFSGNSTKCAFDRLSVFSGNKELATFGDRCGQKAEPNAKNDEAFVLHRGKFGRIAKLGPTNEDVYLLLSETDTQAASHAVLIQLSLQPALVANLTPEGTFRDFNGDGLLDHLVEGGKGIRKGDGALYEPYQVDLQKQANGKIEFVYDEELSKKFSLQSDYLWHGAKADPSITVDPHGKRLP